MENILASNSLESICTFLIETSKEAADIIVTAQPGPATISTKKNNIVSQTDKDVENLLFERITERYPTFKFIGEETYKEGVPITDHPTFIVDPIDGTSNFVHGFPEVCISIGFVVEKQPIVGVVYNPFRGELWSAVKGQGAIISLPSGVAHKLPLISAPLRGLQPACIGIEWGSDREGPDFELNLKVFTTLARTCQTGGQFVNSLRCTGSAALSICRVAAGQQDAFWECGSWAWDVAAAWCILIESGGLMADGHPGKWNPPIDNRRYLAVRPAQDGQQEFVEDFWSVIGDDRSTYGPNA